MKFGLGGEVPVSRLSEKYREVGKFGSALSFLQQIVLIITKSDAE